MTFDLTGLAHFDRKGAMNKGDLELRIPMAFLVMSTTLSGRRIHTLYKLHKRAQFLVVVKASLLDFNRYVTPNTSTSGVSETHKTLKMDILERVVLTDRQMLGQFLDIIDLQHGSTTEMLQRMRKVIDKWTFDDGLFRQHSISKLPSLVSK